MFTIFVPGTWGYRKATTWWKPGSSFYEAATTRGVDIAPPFVWSGEVDGVIGDNRDWTAGGYALHYYLQRFADPVKIVAHSHGGQVALYAKALSDTPPIDTLITVGTPVRQDLLPIRAQARKNIKFWAHLYGGPKDIWQKLGSLFDGDLKNQRAFEEADVNVHVPGASHSGEDGGLLDPQVWERFHLWSYLQ